MVQGIQDLFHVWTHQAAIAIVTRELRHHVRLWVDIVNTVASLGASKMVFALLVRRPRDRLVLLDAWQQTSARFCDSKRG